MATLIMPGASSRVKKRALLVFCGGALLPIAIARVKYGVSSELLVVAIYATILAAVSTFDLEYRIIPNRIIYPATPLVLALASLFPIGLAEGRLFPASLFYSLLGGALGFIALLVPALVREGGMGLGDVKLAGLIGVAVSFPGCLLALGLAIMGSGLLAIALLVSRCKRRSDSFPFGPFLSAGALATCLWGADILRWFFALASA